jgi:predicted esterase
LQIHRRLSGLAIATAVILAGTPAWAQKVLLRDGRTLAGKVAVTSGVAENPNAPAPQAGEVAVRPIVIVDDELRRVFIPKRQVVQVLDELPEQLVKIELWQNVARGGGAVASVGPSLLITPFDEYGRRIFEMQTGEGPVTVIQGITELTPRYVRVEGLLGPKRPIVWDSRLATSSIPVETLTSIFHQAIDRQDWQARLQVVRFYVQAERYHAARRELEAIIAEFPEARDLESEVGRMRQMGARRILRELQLRSQAGQHRLVQQMLQNFPADEVAGVTLQQVRELIDADALQTARIAKIAAQLQSVVDSIADPDHRGLASPLAAEIVSELSPNNVDRLAAFAQFLDDDAMTAEQKAALALTGWLLGPEEAEQNLPVGISLVKIRDAVTRYLREDEPAERRALIDSVRSLEGATVEKIAKLIARLKPPLHDPGWVHHTTGQFEWVAPGSTADGDFVYHVQLPPEYDPYRRYPTLVVLNGAYNTPEQELGFWAGAVPPPIAPAAPTDTPGQDRSAGGAAAPGEAPEAAAAPPTAPRRGQAMRRGYIVLAVEWLKPHQYEYEFSGREHAAVLTCLRDAMRRLAIDTDRVFVSGHGIGGEAALDLAQSHPDLWAGALPFVVQIEKYSKFYWENARHLPLYFVAGELDGKRMSQNAPVLDRYLRKPEFDTTVVEYLGRGHEPYHDEVLEAFEWMNRRARSKPPEEFECNVLRPWDNYFWWVECGEFPRPLMVHPTEWDASRPRPTTIQGKVLAGNRILVRFAAESATLWLSPEIVDFAKPIRITVGRRKIPDPPGGIRPEVEVLLEDVRTRADRQRPFWAKLSWP